MNTRSSSVREEVWAKGSVGVKDELTKLCYHPIEWAIKLSGALTIIRLLWMISGNRLRSSKVRKCLEKNQLTEIIKPLNFHISNSKT